MAKDKAMSVAPTAPTRSEKINLSAAEGRSALAAWRMLFHLYNAQVDKWIPTSDGVEAEGFSVSGQFNPKQVIADISSRTRRLDFLTVYNWIQGMEPTHYADAADITADTVQFYKGAVEEGSAKTPPYVKQAVAAYKAANSLAKKRGPKAKVIRLDNLDELSEEALEGLDPTQIAKVQAVLERVLQNRASGTPTAAASAS